MTSTVFHLALPARDLDKTKEFYTQILNGSVGREKDNWVDIDFFGHQITFIKSKKLDSIIDTFQWYENGYPLAHLGVILEWHEWHASVQNLKDNKIDFLIHPHLMFAGQAGEQKSVFLKDPNGYPVELKTFEHKESIFVKD